jgi:hypothetical protein
MEVDNEENDKEKKDQEDLRKSPKDLEPKQKQNCIVSIQR